MKSPIISATIVFGLYTGFKVEIHRAHTRKVRKHNDVSPASRDRLHRLINRCVDSGIWKMSIDTVGVGHIAVMLEENLSYD